MNRSSWPRDNQSIKLRRTSSLARVTDSLPKKKHDSDWVVFFCCFGDSVASTFLAIACRYQVQHALRLLSSKRNTFHLLTKSQKYKNRMSQKSDILNELNQITYFGEK